MSEYNSIFLRSVGIYCCLEMDEYGKFERKARTLPASMDNATLSTTWDQVMHVNVTVTLYYSIQVFVCTYNVHVHACTLNIELCMYIVMLAFIQCQVTCSTDTR